MSDLCLYELEDNVWDEFSGSDDHIVPHLGDKYGDQIEVRSVSWKKPRHEPIDVVNNADDASEYNAQRNKDTSLPALTKKDTMLEKGSWSVAPDGVYPASCDSGSVKEATSAASEKSSFSSHCLKSENIVSVGSEFCADDPILGEQCAAVDNNTYPLGQFSQTGNDNFFDNDCEDKESSDLIYYGWPDDIGNFEDVDRMFRSCDSTFGLGSLSNEDELCWFSSSHSTEGSEDALKLGSQFSSSKASALNDLSEHHEVSGLNTTGLSVDDANKKNKTMGEKFSSQTAGDSDHSALGHLPFTNGSDTKSINWHDKQSKHQNKSEGKRKERNLENGAFFYHNGNWKPLADVKHSFGNSSHQVYSPQGIQQYEQNSIGSNSFNYTQTHIPYMHRDYSHSSDQISACPSQSGTKSENNGHPSPSLKESSYASNHVQSMGNGHTFEITTNDKGEKLYRCQDLHPLFSRNSKHANMASPTAVDDPVSVQKQGFQSEYEIECHSEIDGGIITTPVELYSSNAQESCCMSSVLEEISLEATSFRQLQQVMEKLDIRTKLCIRDSLYRLARSAGQRHNCANSDGGKRNDNDTGGALMGEETNKTTGFMDIETDTNPIDRSIAHLLFHRPSDPSAMPANDIPSLKSQAMVHESITSPRMTTKEQVCWEESGAGADKSLS